MNSVQSIIGKSQLGLKNIVPECGKKRQGKQIIGQPRSYQLTLKTMPAVPERGQKSRVSGLHASLVHRARHWLKTNQYKTYRPISFINTVIKLFKSWAWWLIPLVPVLGKQRHVEFYVFKASWSTW